MWRSTATILFVLGAGVWLGYRLNTATGRLAIERCDTEVLKLQVELTEARETFWREKAQWENKVHD